MCQWNDDRWNRLLNKYFMPYAYFLKTTNTHLIFTLIDTIVYLTSPSPYLNILYCIPYKLGTTELVLIICFGFLFILFLIILRILHYHKDESNQFRYLQETKRQGKIKSMKIQQ